MSDEQPPFTEDAFTLAALVCTEDLQRRMMTGDAWPAEGTPLGELMAKPAAPPWLLEKFAAAVSDAHVTHAAVIASCFWVSWAIVLTRLGECGWPQAKPSILLADLTQGFGADDDDFSISLVGAVAESATVLLQRRGIAFAIKDGTR